MCNYVSWITCIFLSSKLFLFYFSEFPRLYFLLFAFKLNRKSLKCPWAHWSDPLGQNRNGSVEPFRSPPVTLSLMLDLTRVLALATMSPSPRRCGQLQPALAAP
jgi:hypothetical protein